MFTRAAMIWDQLRNSLWALPMAIVIAAAGMALVTLRLRLPSGGSRFWWLYGGDAAAASDLLANLLAAMITMATLAISITMVVLTLAAQSLGPRLIQIFMGDTRTKLALGLFIGTVVYLLLVLRTIVGTSNSVPQLAVTLSTGLVLTSIVVLLFFVHHLARSIVANTVIRQVGDALDNSIRRLLPEARQPAGTNPPLELWGEGEPLVSTRSGYVQAIDHGALISGARAAKGVIVLRNRPGHYVIAGDTLGWIKRNGVADGSVAGTALDAILIGSEPTPVQDIEYSIRQLVEIALRALSPGINDPFTACAVIDRLAGSIALIMKRQSESSVLSDDDGNVRVVQPTTGFDGLLDASFNQIRQVGDAHPSILIRLADRFGQLLANGPADCAPALTRHLELVGAAGRDSIVHLADRAALEERVLAALNAANRPTAVSRPAH